MQKAVSAREFVKEVKKGNISVLEHTEKALKEIRKLNKQYNFFNTISADLAIEQAKDLEAKAKLGNFKGKLFGLPVSVKDCICIQGIETTSGSKILRGYKPVFDATVVEKVKAEGAIIVGKTSQDEFGFGSFSRNVGVGFKAPKNPFDKKRACGGSSGGSAGITAVSRKVHVSIAESTGGSIASPASFCGVTGITPTYGRVSRYGLIDYANSMDKIGAMGKTTDDASFLLDIISGHDEKESTSLDGEYESLADAEPSIAGMRVGLVKEFFEGCDKEVRAIVKEKIKKLVPKVKVSEVSLPLNAKYGIACYYIIAVSEASTNLAKYSGMRYGFHKELKGNFNEYFSSVRSEAFGEEAKRRILLGTFARMSGFRDAYYLKAMKLRTKLIQEFRSAFEKCDVLANPTMPIIAPKFSEIERLSPVQNYAMDLCTIPANLAGLPHVSVNSGFLKKMPVGIMLTSAHLQEKKIVQLAKAIEGARK